MQSLYSLWASVLELYETKYKNKVDRENKNGVKKYTNCN